MVQIVTVAVSQSVAPTPSTLQKTGALVSQGATTLAAGTSALLTQYSDLTPLLSGTQPNASITWAGGVATVTTTAPHGLRQNETEPVAVTIFGATPAGYNGTFGATATGGSTFTFPLAANPGPATAPGVWNEGAVIELCAMATTFFARGGSVPVYVLELGEGDPADGVASLSTYIANNVSTPQPLPGSGVAPGRFYSYLVPRSWDSEPTFLPLLQSYQNPSSQLYFHVTTTLATRSRYTALNKCVLTTVEAPSVVAAPSTEFSAANAFQASLSYSPSGTNRVTPFAFTYLYGVTPYPTTGNGPLLQSLKASADNVVGTGAEGGISNTILQWGTTKDGRDFTYWYSADWVQINAELVIANAVVNGSNNPLAPLYYDQDGINVLQGKLASLMARGVTVGLVLGAPVQTALDGPALSDAINNGTFAGQTIVNAVPFITYSNENPGDYKIGNYSGLSIVYVPRRGFTSIRINLVVSDFVSQ